MTGLSPKQRNVLEAIRRYQFAHGWTPSVRELGAEFGLGSSTIFGRLMVLEHKGYLRRPQSAHGLGRMARVLVITESGLQALDGAAT